VEKDLKTFNLFGTGFTYSKEMFYGMIQRRFFELSKKNLPYSLGWLNTKKKQEEGEGGIRKREICGDWEVYLAKKKKI